MIAPAQPTTRPSTSERLWPPSASLPACRPPPRPRGRPAPPPAPDPARGAGAQQSSPPPPAAGASNIVITGRRLDIARDSITPSLGASQYTFDKEALEKQPG